MLTTRNVRVLSERDRALVDTVLNASPIANAFVASRVDIAGISESRGQYGAQVWGYETDDGLEGLCYWGSNVVPVGASERAVDAFAARAREVGRWCSSIVGDAPAVLRLWSQLAAHWDNPREVRPVQPLLAAERPPGVTLDPRVRLATLADLHALLPACVAMYTEEVGTSPVAWDGGRAFQARVTELIRAGHMYVLTRRDEVVFKAEIGLVSRGVCQVQGVWTHPAHRGRGVGTGAMAAVTADALRRVAPVVSLYVNDYNRAARTVYERCGFAQVGTFATVLF